MRSERIGLRARPSCFSALLFSAEYREEQGATQAFLRGARGSVPKRFRMRSVWWCANTIRRWPTSKKGPSTFQEKYTVNVSDTSPFHTRWTLNVDTNSRR